MQRLAQCALNPPPNQHLLHVARPLINLAHAHIAVNALQGEVVYAGVAAQGLDGGAADFFGHFAGEQLGHGGFFQAGAACAKTRGAFLNASRSLEDRPQKNSASQPMV